MKNTFLFLLLMCTFVVSAQVEEELIDAVIEAAPPPPPPPLASQPKVSSSLNKTKTEKLRGYRGKSGGRYGFYFNSTWMIPPEYDALPDKYSNFMIAGKNKKYGIIDSKNNVIVPLEYDRITRILKDWETKEETGYYTVKKGKLKGIMSRSGELVVPVQFAHLERIADGLYSIGNKDESYGVVRTDGTEVIPRIYERGFSKVGENRFRTRKDGLVGEVNHEGKVVFPFIYEQVVTENGRIKFMKAGKWGIMDENQKELLKPEYDRMSVKGNQIIVVSKDDRYGAFNAALQPIIPLEYRNLKLIHARYFRVSKEEYRIPMGVIDTLGKVILPFDFLKIERGPGNLIFGMKNTLVPSERLYAVYNESGKEIVPPTFSFVKGLNKQHSRVSLKSLKKYALMDAEGKVVTDYIYDKLSSRMLSRKPLTYQIFAERDGYKGTLKPDGTENDDFKSTAPQRNRQRQRDQNREQRIFKGLVGEWYGVENIGGQEYLTNISILSNTTGIRTVYYLEKGKECSMEQYFSPALLSTMNTMLMKFNSREMNVKCSKPPTAFNLRNDAFFRGNTYSLSGGMNKIGIKNYARKETPASEEDSFEVLRTLKRMYPIAKDLVSKIEKRPGGISNPQITISPITKKVKLITYNTEEIGSIELTKEGDYIFLPGKWQKKTSFALSGVLRNVRYRDENGVEKVGDLDICFDAMSSQPHAFKELKK